MVELLKVQPGSASVLALLNDEEGKVRLIIDRSVLENQDFACHPCRNTSTVSFSMTDLLDKLLPGLKHVYTLVDLPEVDNG